MEFPVYLWMGPVALHPHWVFEILGYLAGSRLYLVLRGRGDTPGALVELRRAEALYHGNPPEREKVRKTIAAMRAAAPDSLRAIFDADSVAASGRRK